MNATPTNPGPPAPAVAEILRTINIMRAELAEIQADRRRMMTAQVGAGVVVCKGDVRLDVWRQRVIHDGKACELSGVLWAVMRTLAHERLPIATRDLIDRCWGVGRAIEPNSATQAVRRLKAKLTDAGMDAVANAIVRDPPGTIELRV